MATVLRQPPSTASLSLSPPPPPPRNCLSRPPPTAASRPCCKMMSAPANQDAPLLLLPSTDWWPGPLKSFQSPGASSSFSASAEEKKALAGKGERKKEKKRKEPDTTVTKPQSPFRDSHKQNPRRAAQPGILPRETKIDTRANIHTYKGVLDHEGGGGGNIKIKNNSTSTRFTRVTRHI